MLDDAHQPRSMSHYCVATGMVSALTAFSDGEFSDGEFGPCYTVGDSVLVGVDKEAGNQAL